MAKAIHEKRGPDRKMPQWSAERRAGLRHWPVISGEPEIGPVREAGHYGAALPHRRLSALRSPSLLGANERGRTRADQTTGVAEHWGFGSEVTFG